MVATGAVLPLCFHVEREGMMGAALGSMWARFWNLNNSEADTIKKVVCEEMIAWGLVDRTDVAVMTQMVSRAVGIGEPADVVVSANLYERQAVSMRLRDVYQRPGQYYFGCANHNVPRRA